MNNLKYVFVMGKSATGKDTLVSNLLQRYPDKFKRIISYTTRDIRSGEQDGLQYHFRDKMDTENMLAETSYTLRDGRTWHYWYNKEDVYGVEHSNQIVLIIVNPKGIKYFQQLPQIYDKALVVMLESDNKVRYTRYFDREISQNPLVENINSRWDDRQISDEKYFDNFTQQDYTLNTSNKSIDEIVDEFISIVAKNKHLNKNTIKYRPYECEY